MTYDIDDLWYSSVVCNSHNNYRETCIASQRNKN